MLPPGEEGGDGFGHKSRDTDGKPTCVISGSHVLTDSPIAFAHVPKSVCRVLK